MKHIFKKLHIGGSNHHDSSSNRSNNETLPSPPSPLSTVTSTAASDHPRNHSPATPPSTTATAANSGVNLQSDYISSEEEFQVQLALAISASNSEFGDKDQIHDATFLTSGRNRIDARREADHAAESLSRRYWDYNVLDYDEKVVDGFYDIYGLSVDPASQGKMPLLSDLQSNSGDPRFQVVLVNRALDPALEELDQVARCFALDCPASELSVLVQRLADLVTEHMGGPVKDANIMLSRWTEKATYLQTSLHTNILPIGSLNIGLSRHRALLFKVLADNVGIPCRLVKGSHYTGIEDDAVNIVKLENERECLVDLMAAPGTLIPADILNIKDTPFSSYNPITLQIANDAVADLSRQDVKHKAGIGKSFIGNSTPSDRNSSSQKPESKPSSSGTSSGELPVRIGSSSDGNSKFVVPANQSNPTSSSAKGTTQYKGKQGNLVIGDSVKQNLNVVPYSQDNREDSKNLFADLNPFQLGSGKSMQNEPPDNKVNDVQRRVDNIASGPGRSPLPVMWKNRNTQNEVPRTKQYEAVVGPRNNHESKHYNSSSQASSSFAPSDKIHSEILKVNVINTSSSSYPMSTSNKNGKPSDSAASLSTLSTSHDKRLLSDEKGSQTVKQDILGQLPAKNLQKEYINDWEIVQTDLVTDTTEHGKNVTSKHDHKKFTHDQLISPKVTSKHLRSSSSVVDAGPEIPWEDLVIGERIGLGSYGEVYHADWKGTEVAVKKFLDQDFSGDALEEFRSEVRIMRRLRHPNVVLFLGAVTRPPHLSIITEFLPRGSLYRIIHRPNCQIDENRRIQMALDVAKGMNCLHNSMPTVVHRDLKSPNLLVDDNWNVKVCDFGLSRLKHNTFLSSKSTAGTPEWMAPEVLRNEPSNEKCDVYSFGVILWELATLRIPWTGMNPMQVVGAVGFQNRRLEIPKEVDPMVARIILGCWQTEPNLRPSFAQLATALKPLQRLVVPSEQQSSQQSLEISVNSTP